MNIPLIRPYLPKNVKKSVCDVLDSGFLTEGAVTKEFEKTVAEYLGVDHCIAVTSCTTGLEMACRCLGIGPGDEVIVPDYTYPATASAVAITGARPVIVDVDPSTMIMDIEAAAKAITPATKAIIPVSLFGNPVPYDALFEMKARHGIYIVEDAACALGAEYRGEKVGGQADITVFSCHPRKFITTGEGGLVVTNNDNWAKWMESYKHFGIWASSSRETTSFGMLGTNYKLSDVLAAIGLSQMEMIEDLSEKRRSLAARYLETFSRMDKISLPETTVEGRHSYQSFCIFIKNRDEVLRRVRERGIEVQIGTYSLHMHEAYSTNDTVHIRGAVNGSRYAYDHCLALPLYHEMTEAEQNEVVNALKEVVG